MYCELFFFKKILLSFFFSFHFDSDMSTFCVLLLFPIFKKIDGFSCPSSQEPDTHLLCQIFQSTDIESKLSVNMSVDDYCSYGWKSEKIGCNSSVSSTTIDFIELQNSDALNGTLNLAGQWPIYTRHIDLESECMFSSVHAQNTLIITLLFIH